MECQATPFGHKCANILPSPPISPSLYAYSSALRERGWCTTTLASPHFLPTPSANMSFNPTKSPPRACDENISALQESPPCFRGCPPHSTSLQQTIMVENFKNVNSSRTATESTQPHLLRREDSGEARPARTSSTASQNRPDTLLADAEHQSDGEELSTGSEKEIVAGAPENLKPGAEGLAEKRKMKRFRSARMSS